MQVTKETVVIVTNFSWAEPDIETGLELYEYNNTMVTCIYTVHCCINLSFRVLRLVKL